MDLPVTVATEEYALDDKAKREYRNQIRKLQEEIDEAEQMNDSERVASLRECLDQILDHLSSTTDIYGRPRKLGSATEKTRSAVTWRIRNAIKKIAQVHPTLGAHLTNSIKTGTYCCYSPEKPFQWAVGNGQ
jgi:RNA processing factor Prp31